MSLDSASTASLGQTALGTTLAVATILALGLLMGGALRGRWLWVPGIAVLLAGLVVTWPAPRGWVPCWGW